MTETDTLDIARTDIRDALLSEPALVDVRILDERELLIQSEADLSQAWMQPRADGTKIGTVVVVEEPYLEDEEAQTSQSLSRLVVPIFCVTHPETAENSELGSGFTAIRLALTVRKCLRGLEVQGLGSFFTEGRSIEKFVPDGKRPEFKDCSIRQVTIKCKLAQSVSDRVRPAPTYSLAGSTVTLACSFGGATIYYTLDGSFPGPGNASANQYSTPFSVTSGQTVRAAAYAAGKSGSAVILRLVP